MAKANSKTVKKQKSGNNQVTGNVGMYYVCYMLSKMGWNVMSTSRNAKGVDIVIYNQDASVMKSIQIKSLSRSVAVPLGKNIDNIFGDYFIICQKVYNENPVCYILKPAQVKKLAKPSGQDGKKAFWLSASDYQQDKFKNWGLIESAS